MLNCRVIVQSFRQYLPKKNSVANPLSAEGFEGGRDVQIEQ